MRQDAASAFTSCCTDLCLMDSTRGFESTIMPMSRRYPVDETDDIVNERAATLVVNEKKIAPHVPVIGKSKREDETFSRSDFTFD
jgi:hypothetical protein